MSYKNLGYRKIKADCTIVQKNPISDDIRTGVADLYTNGRDIVVETEHEFSAFHDTKGNFTLEIEFDRDLQLPDFTLQLTPETEFTDFYISENMHYHNLQALLRYMDFDDKIETKPNDKKSKIKI